MRRLAIPLLLSLLIGISAGQARGQVLTEESIGFLKVEYGLPDSIVSIPIYIQNDSTVSGISFLFEFDHTILHPIIAFNADYQKLLDSADIDPTYIPPDSTEYQATPAYDPGLWELPIIISDEIKDYGWVNPPEYTGISHPTWAIKSVYYNLNARDSVRLLMAPNWVDSAYVHNTAGYVRPHIPGLLVYSIDTLGVNIGYIQFRVDPNAVIEVDQSFLHTTRNIPQTYKSTEFAEEWHDPPGIPDAQTVSVYPQNLLSSVFIVDTADTTIPPPPPDENQLPVLSTISPNNYSIMAGQQVSFNVTATDAESGVVTIRANDGSLTTPNANFGINGVVTGAGGVATGLFSFKPDLDQVGNFSFKFEAEDDSGAFSGAQFVSVFVEGIDEDILFTASAEDIFQQGGVPGLNEVMIPINVITEKTIYGVQFDLTYDYNYFDFDSIIATDRIPDWIIYENNIGEEPGHLRVVAFGLANDAMVPGLSSAVLELAFSVDQFATAGCYPINIFDAWESIDPDPNMAGLEMVTDSGSMCVDRWGDVNLDKNINVADLVSVVAFIIENYDLTRRQFATADVVINDSVNVIDLVGIINAIFLLPISPDLAPIVPAGEFASLQVLHDEITSAGVQSEMALEADLPADIAGVELDLSYNPNTIEMLKPMLTDASDEFQIYSKDNGTGKMKILLHSRHPWNDDELISEGLSDILTLPFVSKAPIRADDDSQVRITHAVISTGAAKGVEVEGIDPEPILPDKFALYQNRPNPFNPTTYIDFYIDGSSGGAETVRLEVFNILGQSVKTLVNEPLPPGMHTVVWDGTDNDGDKSASGVYLYRLRVGDNNQTKKMVLLK
ncbi:MAG: FlgD immunoglobulin-like domain containing protein [candidate division Zixibacteria bacterium]